MQLKYTTRKGAANGQPSYLHIGRSGRTYRTLVQSKIDNPANAIGTTVKRPPMVDPIVTPIAPPVTLTDNVFFYLIVAIVVLIIISLTKK
jgi:hypothetical protein